MKLVSTLFLAPALLVGTTTARVVAGPTDSLFVNLLTDEAHRANMALSFSKLPFRQIFLVCGRQ